jgi:two-component system, chemotaxis family, response regulator Rcp1
MNPRPIMVLIVEDNDADVHLTLTALRDASIANEINVVEDGEQAMSFLKQEGSYAAAPRPDLILLDLNLPKKDGFQVLAEMKANPHLTRIPVIVVSGSAQESDISRAYDLQIAAYLVKPVNVDDYFSAIRAVKELWFHMVSSPPSESCATS